MGGFRVLASEFRPNTRHGDGQRQWKILPPRQLLPGALGGLMRKVVVYRALARGTGLADLL
jgi:hypothetical protein